MAEAALASLVTSAVAWYASDRTMPEPPERVVSDTENWRADDDAVLGYFRDRLVIERGSHIRASVLDADMREWLRTRGQHEWSVKTIVQRFEAHDALPVRMHRRKIRRSKSEPSFPPEWHGGDDGAEQYMAWPGIAFRDANGDDDRGVAVL